MVSQRNKQRISKVVAKKNRDDIKHFYLDGELHRVLQKSKHQNRIIAWNYPQGKKIHYFMSHVRDNMQHAYTIPELAALLCRDYYRLHSYLAYGDMPRPQQTYSLNTGKPGRYMVSEDEVLEWHDFISQKHRGKPRKDGIKRPADMPTRKEMIGILRGGRQLYVKDEETGEMVPVWRESVWEDV